MAHYARIGSLYHAMKLNEICPLDLLGCITCVTTAIPTLHCLSKCKTPSDSFIPRTFLLKDLSQPSLLSGFGPQCRLFKRCWASDECKTDIKILLSINLGMKAKCSPCKIGRNGFISHD